MKISPKQALDLEEKLNRSKYARDWRDLGDILYDWRLNPQYNKVERDPYTSISQNQLIWITNNISTDFEHNKCYKLILKSISIN